MEYLLSFVFSTAEWVSLSFAADAVFKRRDKNKLKFHFILFLNVCASIAVAMALRTHLPIIKAVVVVAFMFIMLWLNYDGKQGYKLFVCLAYFSLLSVLDYIVLSLYMLCFSYSYEVIVQNGTLYVASAVTSKLILLIVTYLVKKTRLKRQLKSDVVTPQAWSLLVVPGFSVLNIFAVFEGAIKNEKLSLWTFVIAVGLLLCNIVAVFLWDKLEDETRLRLENALLVQEVKNNMDKALALESLYVAQRKMSHDFHNHTLALQGLLKAGAYEKAQEYAQKLTQEHANAGETVHTNHQLLDIVFNQKYEYARQSGVTISFLINDLSDLPIKDKDIVTLLTNLLDNAIEAAALCEKEKAIRVKIMRRVGVNLLISVGNSSNNVEIVDNHIVTTKSNPLEHGFGMQNIRQIVEQYGGEFLLAYSNQWFQFTAIFPMKL